MKDSSLPEYHHSIFHQLLEHASDLDCKLLLLEQILELGDTKEIALLEELENHTNLKISEKASSVKSELLSKLGKPQTEEDTLLPMNLCFLYDEFNISPAKVDKDLDFGVTLDIFESE
ncbi:hypothetical protein [Flagellimonas sp.]|uniref:hypothetical protein n=1 Tax=Flagellimonas sp. TaxID=2058762 RepID=UPI003B5B8F0F